MAVEMIEAYVQAGSVETSYLRAGQGAPLILLTHRSAADLMDDPLVHALASRFRLIVPSLPVGGLEDCAWLRDVMDGLGVHDARVLVDAELEEETSALT